MIIMFVPLRAERLYLTPVLTRPNAILFYFQSLFFFNMPSAKLNSLSFVAD